MRVEASGTATFKVNGSDKVLSVHASDLDWEQQEDAEGPMGPSVVHSAAYEVSPTQVITWSLWEYPVGVPNDAKTEVPAGLALLADLAYELVHEPDE